eukprot:SAG31_NODE_116_length_24094_cov_38.884184_13_plen_238_part_00
MLTGVPPSHQWKEPAFPKSSRRHKQFMPMRNGQFASADAADRRGAHWWCSNCCGRHSGSWHWRKTHRRETHWWPHSGKARRYHARDHASLLCISCADLDPDLIKLWNFGLIKQLVAHRRCRRHARWRHARWRHARWRHARRRHARRRHARRRHARRAACGKHTRHIQIQANPASTYSMLWSSAFFTAQTLSVGPLLWERHFLHPSTVVGKAVLLTHLLLVTPASGPRFLPLDHWEQQ